MGPLAEISCHRCLFASNRLTRANGVNQAHRTNQSIILADAAHRELFVKAHQTVVERRSDPYRQFVEPLAQIGRDVTSSRDLIEDDLLAINANLEAVGDLPKLEHGA